MKKSKILTSQSYRHLKSKRDTPVGKSMTIQGDAKSIKDLLIEHTQGVRDPDIEKPGIFNPEPNHDDPDFEKLIRMDIAEIQHLQQHNNELLNEMQLKIKSYTEGKVNPEPSEPIKAKNENAKSLEGEAKKRSSEADKPNSDAEPAN